jgi:hypothetical protein
MFDDVDGIVYNPHPPPNPPNLSKSTINLPPLLTAQCRGLFLDHHHHAHASGPPLPKPFTMLCPTNRSIAVPYEASRSDAASQSAMTIIVFHHHVKTHNSRPFDMVKLSSDWQLVISGPGCLATHYCCDCRYRMRCPCKASPV